MPPAPYTGPVKPLRCISALAANPSSSVGAGSSCGAHRPDGVLADTIERPDHEAVNVHLPQMLLDVSRTIATQMIDELESPLDQSRADLVCSFFRERREKDVFRKQPVHENESKRPEHEHGGFAAAGTSYDLERHGRWVKDACFLLGVGGRRPPSLGLKARNRGTNRRDEVGQRKH